MGYVTVSDLIQRLEHLLPVLSGGVSIGTYASQTPMLAVAFWTGIVVIAVSVLMLIAVIMLRVGRTMRQRQERRFVAQWRPLLAECTFGVPQELPAIPRTMQYVFLKLWIYHLESLTGAARDNLVQLAKAAGADAVVRSMIRKKDLRRRLIAVVALGHLGDRSAWHELRELTDDPSPILSLAAARALLDIDAPVTLDWLIPVIARREDWPVARVVAMLKDLGPDHVTRPLIAGVEAAFASDDKARQVPRLLRMMQVAYPGLSAPVVRKILARTSDAEIIAAALRVLYDPRDLDMLRTYARHESWVVRISAVRALGRIGMPEDRKLLTDMLSDRHWWVRYHAARALIRLPSTTLNDLELIRGVLPDHFAADMLAQAVAEERAR